MAHPGPQPLPAELKKFRGTYQRWREVERGGLSSGDDGMRHPVAGITYGSGKDYLGMAEAYCQGVQDGSIVACQSVHKAVARFQRMRERALDSACPFLFSPEHVVGVCYFAEQCPHVEGRWTTETVTLEPFQVFILAACYGFRMRDTGLRLVTVVFFQVARKSAKSTLVAIAALYHLVEEDEAGAQVVCAATTGAQARLVFGVMQRMVRKSHWLRHFGLQVFANAITLEKDGSKAMPINSKSSTQDGLNPSFISLDESHGQTFELRDVLMSAMGARTQGTMWCPTTAGYDLTSVGYALRQSAEKILDGVIESDHTFVAVYELDDGDDWRDERNWIKAAPMIGVTPRWPYVRKYFSDCQATPGMSGEFETKICNRWLHAANRAIPIEQWDACADPRLRLEQFEHDLCWIGVDLAERDDIAAVALNFRHEDLIVSFVKGFLPTDVIHERAKAVPEYRQWLKVDDLEATVGNLTDYSRIEEYLDECCRRFDVQDIVIERYGALHLAANLQKKGVTVTVESKRAQVCTPPMKELLARLKTKRFRHTGASFLRWQASNLCLERRRDGSMLPTKDNAESSNKIDAIDAILWGWHSLLRAHTAAQNVDIFFI
jgi:phage terminase large subunit-like protein